MACAMGCNLSLLRSWGFLHGQRWLALGRIEYSILLCGRGAAARYDRAAWTGGGARPHMSRSYTGRPHLIRCDSSRSHICGFCLSGCEMGCTDAGDLGAGGLAGGLGGCGRFQFGVGHGGVGGDFFDHFVGVNAELDAADIADSGVEGAKNELGALEFDGAAQQGVDDLDERGLDGFFILEEGGVMDARLRWAFDGAEHALVEVAELLSTESGGAATDSGDLDVGAVFDGVASWHIGPFGPLEICSVHIDPLNNFFVVTG
jgi:hypothetical protein